MECPREVGLASLEARLASLDKRADAFLAVGGGDARPVGVELGAQSLRERPVNSFVDRALRGPDRERRVSRDLARELERLFSRLARLGHTRDEAVALGRPRVDRAAGEDELLRSAHAREPRKELRSAAAGDDPAPHLREPELCVRGGDDEIARKCELEAAGQRITLDRRDRRGRVRSYRPERALEKRVMLAPRRLVHPAALLQVGAGAERAARTRQHDRARVERAKRRLELDEEPGVESVERPRPVQRDDRDLVRALDDDRWLAHARMIPAETDAARP